MTTQLVTIEQIEEVKRIATLNVFASKIAATIISNNFEKISFRQAEILNDYSNVTIEFTYINFTNNEDLHRNSDNRIMRYL